jgi:uncharacterized protein (DUF1697 family)
MFSSVVIAWSWVPFTGSCVALGALPLALGGTMHTEKANADANESGSMNTFVILLRGVMPTGKNKVPMAPLRTVLSEAGLSDVRTYIQSGNVIATSALGRSQVEELVRDVIRTSFGGDLTVVARTAEEFRDIVDRNPFAHADRSRLYFSLLGSPPGTDRVTGFLARDWSPDQVQIIGTAIYTLYAVKLSDSKYNNNYFERILGVAATTRNFNTMNKLVELSAV